jgi:glutathione S-transferase
MQLFGSTRSPFNRKVMIAVHELGLQARVRLQPVNVSLTHTDPELAKVHPLGQIPALLLADGTVLHDSQVICEYLDALTGAHRLVPPGAARWEVLARHATGQALLETLVRLFSERRRTEDPVHPTYVGAFTAKFQRTLPSLEAQSQARDAQSDSFDLGDIAVGCALAYAEFRFPALDWRSGHPALTAHYERICARPSMLATAPQ